MGYLIPVRYGLGVWPGGRIGAPPPPSASSGKCLNEEMHAFSEMGMSEISRNVNLAERKTLAGVSPLLNIKINKIINFD